MTNKPEFIVVHHTASARDTTTVKAVNNFHKTKDWDVGPGVTPGLLSSLGWYVQYHYFIAADGTVTQCALETEVRWHAGGDANARSLAICLAGWFDDGHDAMPTAKQVDSLRRLIQNIQFRYGWGTDKIFGHRAFMKKTCPGTHLSDAWLKALGTPAAPTPDPGLGKRLAGHLLLAVEGKGAIWYVTPEGSKVLLGEIPDLLKAKKLTTMGILNADLAKIPNV